MSTASEINRTLVDKKVNDFYCKFTRLDENDANILGRQVKSISRPNLQFAVGEYQHKAHRVNSLSRIQFDEVSVTFYDDSDSLVTRAIYNQLYKQARKIPTERPDEMHFDVLVEVYSPDGRLTEKFILLKCVIVSVQHSEQVYVGSSGNEITCSLRYHTAEYVF